jgi:hypothetical protein
LRFGFRHSTKQVGEVAPKSEAAELILFVLTQLADPSPRVRYAALNCVGQFSADLAPVLQLESADLVLPALIQVITSEPNVRVRAHAISALSNFSDGCAADELRPHAARLIESLGTLMLLNITPAIALFTRIVRFLACHLEYALLYV